MTKCPSQRCHFRCPVLEVFSAWRRVRGAACGCKGWAGQIFAAAGKNRREEGARSGCPRVERLIPPAVNIGDILPITTYSYDLAVIFVKERIAPGASSNLMMAESRFEFRRNRLPQATERSAS